MSVEATRRADESQWLPISFAITVTISIVNGIFFVSQADRQQFEDKEASSKIIDTYFVAKSPHIYAVRA